MQLIGRTISLRAAFLLVLVLGAGTAAAASIISADPNPAVAAEGTLSESGDITIDSQQLRYNGTEVEGVDIVVNNTSTSTTPEGILHVAVRDSAGSHVTSTSTSTQTFSGDTTTVTIEFGQTYAIENVKQVEVTVEQTS